MGVRTGIKTGIQAFCDQAEDFFNGQGAGDFAGCGSAHAVADQVDAVFDGVAEGVFVGGALAATIGKCSCGKTRDSGSHKTSPSH